MCWKAQHNKGVCPLRENCCNATKNKSIQYTLWGVRAHKTKTIKSDFGSLFFLLTSKKKKKNMAASAKHLAYIMDEEPANLQTLYADVRWETALCVQSLFHTAPPLYTLPCPFEFSCEAPQLERHFHTALHTFLKRLPPPLHFGGGIWFVSHTGLPLNSFMVTHLVCLCAIS